MPDNLLLLCPSCHRAVDSTRTPATISRLQQWKRDRQQVLSPLYGKRFDSFGDLEHAVVPLLKRNGQIFDAYGPAGDEKGRAHHSMWLRSEKELISNNRRLELMLVANKHLLHRENKEFVDDFVAHCREFVDTREDSATERVLLFPDGLLALFNLKQQADGYPPSLSALQNFVSGLSDKGNLVSLNFDNPPRLTYLEDGKIMELMLSNRPRLQQLFWAGHHYRPQTTEVRLEGFIFFLNWLKRNHIVYEFPKFPNLTELMVGGRATLILCYKYIVSLADLQEMSLSRGNIVINLHNWNDGPVSEEAHEFASEIGVLLMNQNDFFVFAHGELK